jgi:hypothetical protein
MYSDNNVSHKHSASILRAANGGAMSRLDVGTYLQVHTDLLSS